MTPKPAKTVLIADDELEVRRYLEMAVRSLGFSVKAVRDGDEVIACLQSLGEDISAVLLDMVMLNRGGLDTLREIRMVDSKLPVILISGMSSIRDAVTAIQCGGTDFLCKPVAHEDLSRVLSRVMEDSEPSQEPARVAGEPPSRFFGDDSRIRDIRSRAGQIGRSGAPVLIQGETGSGKEVLARELHSQSNRANKPFLKLNCAALPSELVESELFGFERGAFTGAYQKKAGMFELADGGTILLDEIGDMDVRLQAKLLQVLQDQEFRRIGGHQTIKVDVRIMAATHRNLERAIHEGTFREDLYYRLSVIVIQVPALRERGGDIIPLGEILLRKYAAPNESVPALTPDLKRAMVDYSWPGNVRELENYMRNLVIFDDAAAITAELRNRITRKPVARRQVDDHVEAIERVSGSSSLEEATRIKRQAETEAILAALNTTRWNRRQAASNLKIDYKSLLYKMKKLGIDDNSASLPAPEETQHISARAASGD
ncbi:MAG: sigma-54 dependent transcriptional regulator [Terriglobia bacterium]